MSAPYTYGGTHRYHPHAIHIVSLRTTASLHSSTSLAEHVYRRRTRTARRRPQAQAERPRRGGYRDQGALAGLRLRGRAQGVGWREGDGGLPALAGRQAVVRDRERRREPRARVYVPADLRHGGRIAVVSDAGPPPPPPPPSPPRPR